MTPCASATAPLFIYCRRGFTTRFVDIALLLLRACARVTPLTYYITHVYYYLRCHAAMPTMSRRGEQEALPYRGTRCHAAMLPLITSVADATSAMRALCRHERYALLIKDSAC